MDTALNPNQLVFPAIIFVVMVTACVFCIRNQWRNKGWAIELIAALAAGAAGVYFGERAQELYRSEVVFPLFGNGVENPLWIGSAAGGVLAVLAGIWFAKYLRELHAGGYNTWDLFRRGAATGIGLGVLCSTLVHILLMTAYRNLNLWPTFIGAGFGLAAGLAAGFVISIIFIILCRLGLIKAGEQS